MMVSKRNLLFQELLFRFHVEFQGCIEKIVNLLFEYISALIIATFFFAKDGVTFSDESRTRPVGNSGKSAMIFRGHVSFSGGNGGILGMEGPLTYTPHIHLAISSGYLLGSQDPLSKWRWGCFRGGLSCINS